MVRAGFCFGMWWPDTSVQGEKSDIPQKTSYVSSRIFFKSTARNLAGKLHHLNWILELHGIYRWAKFQEVSAPSHFSSTQLILTSLAARNEGNEDL